MRGFELPTNFSHLWWGRKRLCFKHKNTVGLQIFVRRSIRTLNISTLFRPFTPSPPPPSASSPSPPPPPPPPLLRLLPLPSSASSPSPPLPPPPPTKIRREKMKVTNSVFSWERKSTTGIFATGCFWLCTWKISSVAKDKVDNISLDISLVRCANYWAMELNRKKEIPYLSAPMCNSLWLHFYNMLLHCTVGGELKVLLSNRVWFHFSGFSSGDIFKKKL